MDSLLKTNNAMTTIQMTWMDVQTRVWSIRAIFVLEVLHFASLYVEMGYSNHLKRLVTITILFQMTAALIVDLILALPVPDQLLELLICVHLYVEMESKQFLRIAMILILMTETGVQLVVK